MRRFFLVSSLCLVSLGAVYAHPHVFIDASLSFEFEGQQCKGFWQEWVFDPVFSAQLKYDFMLPASGRLSQAAQDELYNGAFINLRRYGFYTLLRQGDRRESPKAVSEIGRASCRERV